MPNSLVTTCAYADGAQQVVVAILRSGMHQQDERLSAGRC
jgi:hypothetical protein